MPAADRARVQQQPRRLERLPALAEATAPASREGVFSQMKEDSKVRVRVLDVAVLWMEVVSGVLLVLLAAIALLNFVGTAWELFNEHLVLDGSGVLELIDAILIFFIVIELFKIAMAYVRKENVVPTVLEAALVAVARKIVVLAEVITDQAFVAIAVAVLLMVLGLTWYVLAKAGICGGAVE
jgi:uncharacterized membrane protein (DUF373 family)